MKLRVITDQDGHVLATAPIQQKKSGKGAPKKVGMMPVDGQVVVEVDVPAKVLRMDPESMHRLFRVKMGPSPKLVEVKEATTRRKK